MSLLVGLQEEKADYLQPAICTVATFGIKPFVNDDTSYDTNYLPVNIVI